MKEHSRELTKLFKVIRDNGGEGRFVGGAVRDFLLSGKPLESGDIDIAVNLPPEKIAEIFSKLGRVVTKYSTNIIVLKGKVFEVTSTRKDVNHDGRYAKMIFTPSFEEDAKRRDFTINALYIDEKGEIFDYVNGISDLKLSKVRFIGNADARIREDYLRIWRFFRFSCLYAKTLDMEGYNACIQNKEGLKNLSKERITHEMLKLIMGSPEKVRFYLEKMIESGILRRQDFDLSIFSENIRENAFLRLCVLTKGKKIDEFLYTAKQQKFLKFYSKISSNLKNKKYIYLLYYKSNPEDLENALYIADIMGQGFPVEEIKKELSELPPLPFTHADIIKEGFKDGEISMEYEKKLLAFCDKLDPNS
jgi:tRNA nucleotidyltransferase/poly(A) polymerase